jgi:hypothetical protein
LLGICFCQASIVFGAFEDAIVNDLPLESTESDSSTAIKKGTLKLFVHRSEEFLAALVIREAVFKRGI